MGENWIQTELNKSPHLIHGHLIHDIQSSGLVAGLHKESTFRVDGLNSVQYYEEVVRDGRLTQRRQFVGCQLESFEKRFCNIQLH